MRLTISCALLGAFLLGCQPQPVPTPPPSPYTQPTHEVTNGVWIVFPSVPSTDLSNKLFIAGAVVTGGTNFIFETVNTAERREAVTAALLRGAELKGAQR